VLQDGVMESWTDWGSVALGLFGGLALFLIGMDQMTDALKALAGHRLQRILSRLSGNRVTGALTGTVTTAALQSSSITTVLTVGLVSAEMLTLTQAASVIVGANLGTTVTAQIIALNISELALGLIAIGAVLWLFVSHRTWKTSGQALASLGLVFLGLKVMGEAMLPLATYQPVIELLSGATNPFVALAAGAVVTALIQSSSATTGIVIAISAAGLIDLPTGIAIILGANVGTCVTALLAAIGKGRPALRAAMVHVLVNLLGALVWLLLLRFLVDLVEFVNPSDVTSPRQLANAHTIFNLVNTVVFLALLTPLVALVTRLIPDRRVSEPEVAPGHFLDVSAVGTAALGLPAAIKETTQMGLATLEFFDAGFANVLDAPAREAMTDEVIESRKQSVRAQHRAIVGYLAELSHSAKDDAQSLQLLAIMTEADEIAHLADSLASSFRRINRRRRRTGVILDPEVTARLRIEQSRVGADLGTCLGGLPDGRDAGDEDNVRLRPSPRHDMDSYILESDLGEVLARVDLATTRIGQARVEADADGAERPAG
jgi:phosphate:Na+ symporter